MTALAVLAVVAVVIGGAIGALVLATQSRREFRAANRVVGDVESPAPASWAGSHDPEARLHRRLRDAMSALSANQAFDDDGGLLDLRVELEQQALALDTQLVAIAGLSAGQRPAQLARAEESVAAIEATVGSLVGVSAADTERRMGRLLDELASRTGVVREARSDVEGPTTDPGTGTPGTAG